MHATLVLLFFLLHHLHLFVHTILVSYTQPVPVPALPSIVSFSENLTSNMPASVASGEEDEQDVQSFHVDIDELQNHGINVSDIVKLKANNYHTVGVSSMSFP